MLFFNPLSRNFPSPFRTLDITVGIKNSIKFLYPFIEEVFVGLLRAAICFVKHRHHVMSFVPPGPKNVERRVMPRVMLWRNQPRNGRLFHEVESMYTSWGITLYFVIPASVTGGFQFNTTESLPKLSTSSSRHDSGTTKTRNKRVISNVCKAEKLHSKQSFFASETEVKNVHV